MPSLHFYPYRAVMAGCADRLHMNQNASWDSVMAVRSPSALVTKQQTGKTPITHFPEQVADPFDVEDPLSLWIRCKESLVNSLHIYS